MFKFVLIKRKCARTLNYDTTKVYVKPKDIYEDIAKNVERRFDTSNYELEESLTIGKNKRYIGLMIAELGRKIMTDIAALILKIYSYLTDSEN